MTHRIRIKKIISSLWKRSDGRACDAYQWVCACERSGPERTTRGSAETGGAQHLAAIERRERAMRGDV